MTRQERANYAFNLGVKAAQDGGERVTPYRMCFEEKYWYAGYDSVK